MRLSVTMTEGRRPISNTVTLDVPIGSCEPEILSFMSLSTFEHPDDRDRSPVAWMSGRCPWNPRLTLCLRQVSGRVIDARFFEDGQPLPQSVTGSHNGISIMFEETADQARGLIQYAIDRHLFTDERGTFVVVSGRRYPLHRTTK